MLIAPLPTATLKSYIPTPTATSAFLSALKTAGFAGEIADDYANCTVLATDNSIYQRWPQACLFPKHAQDVALVAKLLDTAEYRRVSVTARGGGTGTNGQSLTEGVVLDLSKHMNQIVEINPRERWVRVQAGVVKDQLNAALKPHGLFFAPELSTSNRATLGGMINTDASGQGSCVYGKTRNHVLALDFVLLGGQRLHSRPVRRDELEQLCAAEGRRAKVYQTARHIAETKAELIQAKFPKLNRCLTGYDLAHLYEADGRFNLNSVLCGAEGSLGFVVEATLNALPIPKYSVLVNVRYASFMDALRDAKALMEKQPLSIETVDSKVLQLAMEDFVWSRVADYFPQEADTPTLGINLIEFCGDDESAVNQQVAAFVQHLQTDFSVKRLGHTLAEGSAAVEIVYSMRKRAVGLLGNVQGEARPQPFVEDTAVPPEQLADYIAEFRALLDAYGLYYGMFGHVDAGVLHVRPALDMKDPKQAALVRPISDAVAELTHKYGGLLWGEHGKGVRSEYAPKFFGELYPALQELKAAFDPHNQLNPGKIATPANSKTILLKVDEVPTRGSLDRQIDERIWQSYASAMHCNGNGACYNFDPDDAMCPSWKATRQRVHSPKGRASLLREWLRLQGQAGVNVLAAEKSRIPFFKRLFKQTPSQQPNDFSHEVYEALAGCLGCKSCAGQCPIKVNVPEFRSRFLQLYHRRYARPLRDYLIASLESTIPALAKIPGLAPLYNTLMQSHGMRRWLELHIGMVDSPLLSRYDFNAFCRQWNVQLAQPKTLAALTPAQRQRSVMIVPDCFSRYFDPSALTALIELAARLGFSVFVAPFAPNGKPLHVQGFLYQFDKTARRTAEKLNALAAFDIPLIGLDPAMTLMYRQEYRKVNGLNTAPTVLLPQEWLLPMLSARLETRTCRAKPKRAYRLLQHCTEKTNAPDSGKQWQQVFAHFGLNLHLPASGCCGMSGTYGHEARNLHTSLTIYAQSWQRHVENPDSIEGTLLATGYSCRSQVKRLSDMALPHPLHALLEQLRHDVIEQKTG